MAAPRRNPLRRSLLHVYRVAVFVVLLVLIHRQHGWYVAQKRGELRESLRLEQVGEFFPGAAALSDWDPGRGGQNVLDGGGGSLGYVLQTSPEADEVIGFSGPTNSMIAFSPDHRVLGVAILRSEDTREHVGDVVGNAEFLGAWKGLSRDEAGRRLEVDAVSGATLTSMAIADGIAVRLGGSGRSRFPDGIGLDEVRAFLPGAQGLEPIEERPHLLRVRGVAGETLGFAARTSPHADHMMGYQGPVDVLIVLDSGERVLGLALRKTYENEPFVSYVAEDEYFFNIFKGFALEDVSGLDMVEAGIDGVSGATKTSVTVAEGLIHTAGILLERRQAPAVSGFVLKRRDIGTAGVVLAALVIAFTPLRGNRRLRIALQVVLVGYLGFVNAEMLSQALMVGWAQNGVAWRGAPGLVLLTAAALIAPVFTGRQAYCTHICPFGAAQDLVGGRRWFRLRVAGRVDRLLRGIPVVLLGLVVIVAMGQLRVSLVGIEPFDAFVLRVAGGATIAIAVVGLVASLFVTRAYCRYGCPTGAMLGFLRFGGAGERFDWRDGVAALLVAVAAGMMGWR